MLKAWFKKYQLQFKQPVLTSRGSMKVKNGYFLFISDGEKTGIGECSYIEGLSTDDMPGYEKTLTTLCAHIEQQPNTPTPDMQNFPSLRFGLEVATLDLKNKGKKIVFDTKFTCGEAKIPINGLVWMGTRDAMLDQIASKIKEGFSCIKVKVGALNFKDEISVLDSIRRKYSPAMIEIRLDANGAFSGSNVFKKLESLSKFGIHSIEQPIQPGQLELLQEICKNSPIPVALDEELIYYNSAKKEELLASIKPKYIILKPSLLGGWQICDDWIKVAEKHGIDWWATSALESNIGLNAIAQWVFTKKNKLVQGLGTGSLYNNNISSPLYIEKGKLGYHATGSWAEL